MFLISTVAFATEKAYLHAFLNQPIDVALLEIILLFGWIPIAAILLDGFMEIWKDYKQGLYQGKLRYSLLAIDVPKMTEQSPKALENFFASLQGGFSNLLWKEKWFDGKVLPRFSLEIASIDGYIQYYIRCENRFRDMVEAGIYAQYPDAQIAEVEDYLQIIPARYPDPEWDMWGTEFVMKKDQYMPFRTWPDFEHSMSQELKDPLAVLLEQMSRMRIGECFFFQLMFTVVEQKTWKEEGGKFIQKIYGIKDAKKSSSGILTDLASFPGGMLEEVTGVGLNTMLGLAAPAEKPKDEDQWKAFKITLREKAQVEGVTNKISKIGFPTKIRIAYFAKKGVYSKGTRVPIVKGFLLPFNHPDMNEFGMYNPQIPKFDYFWQRWGYNHRQTRVAQALKNRSFSMGAIPKVMCTEEMATLWHFPTITIKAPLIKKTESRRAEPPVSLPIAGEDVPLYRAVPTPAKKEAPPASLPVDDEISTPGFVMSPGGIEDLGWEGEKLSEPNIQLDSPFNVPEVKKPSVQPQSTVAPIKKIPDALRLLIDPDVELEDVNLPPPAHEKEHVSEGESAPPNLPL
ncbi:MAG: hypothetical protein V1716_04760 [Candidatus Uhrbacteria bacterium]